MDALVKFATMSAGITIAITIVGTICAAISIVGTIRMYQKAGAPGWAAIVPIYSFMPLSAIAGFKPALGLVCLIPCVGSVFSLVLLYKAFTAFGFSPAIVIIGLLFPPVMLYMYIMIAFSVNCQFRSQPV